MKNVKLYLPDGDFDGSVWMESTASAFTAIRVRREDIDGYSYVLNHQGIYMLLIGTDTIYVGQTSHDIISERIFNTHIGNIDSIWHTLVAFPYVGTSVSTDELLYLENAMCEYVYTHNYKCATTNPSKGKCNECYRNSHFQLSNSSIYACKAYIGEMESYIKLFRDSLFIPDVDDHRRSISQTDDVSIEGDHRSSGTDLFCLVSLPRDVNGIAEIPIHQGHTGKRKAIVKAGSRVSKSVLKFGGTDKIIALRQQLEAEGKLIDRIMQVDYEFPSQSAAGCFVNGGSFNGNEWKRVSDGMPLKQLL